MAARKSCKGCGSFSRKLPFPGPRCGQCHRAIKEQRNKVAHEAYVLKTYGLKAGEYDRLLEAQEGLCYICRRANGRTKRLAVDHDHSSGCVRGLLCGVCNKILGHLRDDPDLAYRIADYLVDPPARRFIGMRKPDGE